MAARKGPRYKITASERKDWQAAVKESGLSIGRLAELIGKVDPSQPPPGESTLYRVVYGNSKQSPLVPHINRALERALADVDGDGDGECSEEEMAVIEALRAAQRAGVDGAQIRSRIGAMVRELLEEQRKRAEEALAALGKP